MTEERPHKQHKTYISGKTSGVPVEFVQKKFEIAENYLLSLGMEPVNPLKNGLSENHTKKQHLLKDIGLLLSSNSIFILDNWIDSKQSRIEKKIAEEYGLTIMFESNSSLKLAIIENLKDAINEVMGLKFEDYTTKSRSQRLFYARMIVIYYCRERENMTVHEIANLINRDHTTVLHGIKTYKNEIKYNHDFREKVSRINLILTK